MSGSARRIGAILWADFLVRLRKPSTVVVFLLLCFTAYLWVPDPSAGYTLMSIQGQRVIYDSPAMALATGSLFTLLIALFGFFLVKGSIGRDLDSRCGLVIASTPVKSWEYLLGKGLGNMAFLGSLAAGYLVSSMVMQLVRGEAPLDPRPYVVFYALLLPPTLAFVAFAALLFESIPWLAGRLGEVAYFFLWGLLLAVGIGIQEHGSPASLYVDFTGGGFLMQALQDTAGTMEVAIGASEFDATLTPLALDTLDLRPQWIPPRVVSTVSSVPLLLLAVAVFHRFDPSRSRVARRQQGHNWIARLASLARRPLSWLLSQLPSLRRHASFQSAILSEAAITLLLHPLAVWALMLTVPVSLLVPASVLARGVLPAVFALLAIVFAEASSREQRSGTATLVHSIPHLERAYLWWKLGAAMLLGIAFLGMSALRLGWATPSSLLSLSIGLFFLGSTATATGFLAGTPRAFVVLFLSFWYVVLNDGGRTPVLDFAGFYGIATPSTRWLYLVLAVGFLAIAQGVHTLRRRSI